MQKELTEYETAIIEKINSRMEFLSFIKKGIQFYGHEKYKSEINGLKLDKNLDTETLIRIPYNIDSNDEENKKIKLIIDTCINNYNYSRLTFEDVTNHEFRGNVTYLRVAIVNLLNKYAGISPSKIASIIKRSRQVAHSSFIALETAIKNNFPINLVEMYNKMDYEVGLHINEPKFQVKDFSNADSDNSKSNVIISKIAKRIYKLVLNEYKLHNNNIIYRKGSISDITKTCITLLKISTNVSYPQISSCYSLSKNKTTAIMTNHIRSCKKDRVYARKINILNKLINKDATFNSLRKQLYNSNQ